MHLQGIRCPHSQESVLIKKEEKSSSEGVVSSRCYEQSTRKSQVDLPLEAGSPSCAKGEVDEIAPLFPLCMVPFRARVPVCVDPCHRVEVPVSGSSRLAGRRLGSSRAHNQATAYGWVRCEYVVGMDGVDDERRRKGRDVH